MKMYKRIILAGLSLAVSFGLLAPSAFAVSGGRYGYAALGDSIAAGVGLAPVPNATAADLLCGRSAAAYPQLVASGLNLPLTTNAACGGAKVQDLYNQQTINGTSLAPQIDAAFANGTPKLITLTIGANDLGWSTIVGKCYTATCGTTTDSMATKVARAHLRAELSWALLKINRLSDNRPPKVLVTGYFMPFNTQQCGDTQGLTPAEMTWLNSQVSKLNQAVKSVTKWFDAASFVPVDFSGHEFCSATPWIQGLQSPAPYHPTAAGQQAIATAVRAAY